MLSHFYIKNWPTNWPSYYAILDYKCFSFTEMLVEKAAPTSCNFWYNVFIYKIVNIAQHKYNFVEKLSSKHLPLYTTWKKTHSDLITHPVVASLLSWKWKHYVTYFYIINLNDIFHLIFLAFQNGLALALPNPQHTFCKDMPTKFACISPQESIFCYILVLVMIMQLRIQVLQMPVMLQHKQLQSQLAVYS